ncbi:MAG: outer membrane beta-barrel protein, partial [Bacteroidota bacterium]
MLNTRLNRLITLTLLFTPGVYSYAQTKYEVSGQVFDEMNEPMPFVNVGFFTLDDDVPIGGRASAIDGTFSYELEGGVYKIKVSFIGYKTFYLDSLQVNENLELPFIYLKPDAQELENVVIVSERPTVQTAPGVKTYNISENAVSESSTALDILRNLPSTQVDADDEITLRGRKVTILVDGVEMDMENILEQIPADRIESIDVMSNPSAKYDTQNGEGVLNIRLRKNKKTGYSTYAGLGIGNSGRYNPSFGGSHTKGKLSINGGGQVIWNVNKDRSSNYRTSFRVVDTLNEGGSQTFVREAASFQDQKYRTTDDQLKYNYRLKSRYQLDDRNNLEISMAGGINDFARDRTYEQDFFNKDKEVTRTLNRKMEGDYITHWWNTSSRYHWKKNEGHEFIATINFHKNDRQDHHTFLDSLFRSSGEFNRVNRFDSISDGNLDKKLRMKVDYESPIANGHSIEVGGVATVRSVVRDYQYRNVDRADFTTWMLDSARSNVYDYDDRNYGVYGLVKGPAIFSDRLTYATGLRFNTAYLSPKSRTDTQSNDSRHVFWSPSFQLSYVINDVQSMSFNYSGKTKLP